MLGYKFAVKLLKDKDGSTVNLYFRDENEKSEIDLCVNIIQIKLHSLIN